MLTRIIHFSIHNKLLVLLAVLFMAAYGVYQLRLLPIDAVPDITDNQVQVITVSPALGAPDVERFISFPIEQANSNIPGLKSIRSFSRFGLSVVTIVFEDNVDVYWARQQVTERLQQVKGDIPDGMGSPVLAPVTTGLGEIYQYIVKAKPGYEQQYSPMELRTIQDWIVRKQLLGVPGVADVSSFGGQLKQYHVLVNSAQLHAQGLSINDVFEALERNNQNAGGAYIEKGPQVLFIRSEGLVSNKEDIEAIVVKTNQSGIPVKIGDVARVELGMANRYGALCYNDEGEAAGAVLMMLKGENSSAVIQRVKARIEEIRKSLPEGVVIEAFLDRTKMVNNAIHTVEKNLLEGALIVVFVLVLFLGNLRAGLITASVIPLSLLFAVIMMNMFGVSGNLMSLGALDFGLIVDGAVIIVEAVMHHLIYRRLSGNLQALTQGEMDATVDHSAGKMMNAAVFGQVIILIVYLPIFALEGIEGKMFRPMAQTVAFALLGAFILSLTYIPTISALLLSKKNSGGLTLSDRLMLRLEGAYERLLSGVMRWPKSVVGATILLFLGSTIILSRLGGEFIPELEEGDFAVDTRVLTGSNLQTTIENTQKTAHILLERFPEVEKVVTKIGSGEIPTDPMPIEASDMMVILKDKSQWTSAKSFDALAEKMSAAISEVPGVTAGFQFPVQMRFNELMTGARQDVVCKIFGENMDSLRAAAEQLGHIIPGIEGARDLYIEAISGMPQVVIKYNRSAMAQYGVSIETLNRSVQAAFAGSSAGQVFEEEKRFDLMVKLAPEQRKGVENVQQLLISTPGGIQVPLSSLAAVAVIEGPAQIQREQAQRRISVGFNVRGRDVESLVEELQAKVARELKLPPGYFIRYGGSFENLKAANARLQIAVPVSLLLIFLLLYFAFKSVKQGLLIFTAIPLSAIGGILVLAIRDMPFSISAGIGFIALFGVSVLNGIVLISEFNQLRQHPYNSLKNLVITGAKHRLRPVLMTASVASLGFLPMAFSNGAGAEVQRPLASVVIGGLISATFLTLFLLPMLYIWLEKKGVKPSVTFIFLLIGLQGFESNAQKAISLPEALKLATVQNPDFKPLELQRQHYEALLPSSKQRPPVEFNLETGQFNSRKTDYRFSAVQSFQLPGVTEARKQLLMQQARYSAQELAVQKRNFQQDFTRLYLSILHFREEEKVLLWADSLFEQYRIRAANRVQMGESPALELTNASIRQSELQWQLLQLDQEKAQLVRHFNRLLGAENLYIPDPAITLTPAASYEPDSMPLFRLRSAALQLKNAAIVHESAQFSPEPLLGINLQSISGFQNIDGTDRYFDHFPPFVSVQTGVKLPIQPKVKSAREQALLLSRQVAMSELEQARIQEKRAWEQWSDQYTSFNKQLVWFEQHRLPLAKRLEDDAGRQLLLGEINYLDWGNLLQECINIKIQHAQLIRERNEILAQGLYFNFN